MCVCVQVYVYLAQQTCFAAAVPGGCAVIDDLMSAPAVDDDVCRPRPDTRPVGVWVAAPVGSPGNKRIMNAELRWL